MTAPATRRWRETAEATAPSRPPAPTSRSPDRRWRDRPALATAVRVAVVAIPFAASLAAAWAVAGLLSAPEGRAERFLWWTAVVAASLAALLAFDRAARRLLPLAALLQLSLIFPDRAPSRFGVALRSGSTRRLHDQEVEALQRGDQEPAEAARTILTLAASLNVHDRNTRGHSERVRAYADLIGAELGLDPDDRDRLRWAALLHDVGKVTVPAHTLHADGLLTDADWETLRRHPLEGARLVEPLRAWLGPWALAIEQHHERFDGTGYPYGLRGDELSLAARIVAVADSYDAMTSSRSYARAVSPAAARRELAAQAGTHFDPAVVRAFLSISLGRLRWVLGPLAFFAAAPFALPGGALRRSLDTAGRTVALGTASLVSAVAVVQPAAPPPAPRHEAPAPRPAVRSAQPAAPAPWSTAPAEPPAAVDPVTVQPAAAAAAVPPVDVVPPPAAAAEVPATVAPPVVPTSAPAAPAATPPPTLVECRTPGSEASRRPCQPPRWGLTEDGNPRADRD